MNKFTFAALLGAMMLTILPCSSALAAADNTIKIGVAGAHSGDNASYGTPALEAARLVAEKYNAAGGVLDKKVIILAQDDQCKGELASNAATKLIADGVIAVLGHTCSGPTEASLPLYSEAKILLISPSATAPALTQVGKSSLFFRTIASDDAQAKIGADFVLDKLQAKNIAILHDKGGYGKGYADFVKSFIEQSGKAKIALFEGITTGAVDYSAVVLKIASSGADAVVFGGYQPEAAKLVTQMRKRRMTIPFVSEDGVKVDNFLRLAGSNAEGVYASGPRDLTKQPATKGALAAYQEKYNKAPGQYYLESYSAMESLLTAIQKTGGTDAVKLAAYLRANTTPTVLGPVIFDKNGDAQGVGMTMFVVKNGVFTEAQ